MTATLPVSGFLFHVSTAPHPSGEFISWHPGDGKPVVHCSQPQAEVLKYIDDPEVIRLLVCAGFQSGKSSIGPPWIAEQMRRRGPGNYLLAAPTFRLLDMQPVRLLNRFLGRLLGLGKVVDGAMGEFRVSEAGHKRLWGDTEFKDVPYYPEEPSRVKFGYAQKPDSLASMTAKAAWLDEPGQTGFKAESYEEVRGRLSTTGGPMLLTTRPYVHHWLKTEVYDRAVRVRGGYPGEADAGHRVVQFSSLENPRFSRQEYYQAKATMPGWRFAMKYDGEFTRPAGLIFHNFDPARMVVGLIDNEPWRPPDHWRIHVGIDFGAPNFAAVFFAEEQDVGPPNPWGKRYIAYKEYRPDETRTAAEHVKAMRELIGKNPTSVAGGSKSETAWRAEFRAANWSVNEPKETEVEIRIDRMFGVINTNRLFVSAACPFLLRDIANYSRPVDEATGEVLEGIQDQHAAHSVDACGYFLAYAEQKTTGLFFISLNKPKDKRNPAP